MSEAQEKILAFDNQFHEFITQTVEGIECVSMPFPVIKPTDNLVTLRLTQGELLQLLSSIQVGAEWTYPDKSQQILFNFMKGLICAPILEEQDCFEYQSFASFVNYSPVNPYISPDEIPDGYLSQPFLVNGQNGVDIPNYELLDILVPIDAITLDVNWFDDIGGQLPQITVNVQGAGQVLVKMLSQVQGGLAVITVDNPPNILDIIGGIITGADNIVDLNLDIVALPPETAIEVDYPLEVTGTGMHTIYIVFLPILDDSLMPLRFGGGFRGVTLCDFVEQPMLGIQDIRFDAASCELQTLIDGVWTIVAGWENWLDCVPTSGGGGGGAMAMTPTTKNVTLGANDTTTSTTYATTLAGAISHVFTKTKALIQLVVTASNGGAASVFIKPNLNSGGNIPATNGTEGRTNGTTQREVVVADVFENIPAGTALLSINWKVSGGTGTITANYDVEWTIIEYDEATDLFVEAVRINGEELQYLKGGIWITATDSLKTILDAMQAATAAAQTAANGAVSVNSSQQTQINAAITVNNAQNVRLNDLEAFQADAELSFLGIQAQLDSHQSSIISISQQISVLAFGGVWAQDMDLTSLSWGWSLVEGTGWSSGNGWRSNTNGLVLQMTDAALAQNQITHVNAAILFNSAPTGTIQWRINGSAYGSMEYGGIGGQTDGWLRVPNAVGTTVQIEFSGFGDFYLRTLNFLGRGDTNPFLP